MTAVPVVLSPEPFSRSVEYMEALAGQTVRAMLLEAVSAEKIALEALARAVLYVDGVAIPRDEALDRVLSDGETINIVVEPLGGGGGGGSGNPEGRGDGTDGTDTTFGQYAVGGGKRGGRYYDGNSDQTQGGFSGAGWRNLYGQYGGPGAGNGFTYASGGFGGGDRGGLSAPGYPGQDAAYASGCGGSGGGAAGAGTGGGNGGGEGGLAEILIENPAETYAFSIGSGGNGGAAGSDGWGGGHGGDGFLEVIAEF